MAASVMPQPGMMPGQQPPAPKQQMDPTPSNPSQATGEQEKPDANGLLKKDRDNLMYIRRTYKERWSSQRRAIVRGILKRMEYVKGNQFYSVSPDGVTFQNPFDQSGDGTQQSNDADSIYSYVTNIIQWFERVLVSTLSASVPATRFQPSNAQSDLGNRVAQQASRANAYIERLNDEKALTEQKVSYLSLAGSYFVYTRPMRDSRLSGNQTETLTTEEMQDTEVKPDRYLCRGCGAETPVQNMLPESQFKCENCQQPLGEGDFYPSVKVPMPVVTASQELPAMQPRKSLYHGLHVDAMPSADSENGDPLMRTPLLDLSLESDIGALRAMYPNLWKQLENGSDSSGTGEVEQDRTARLQSTSQVESSKWNKSTGLMTRGQMPTYSRTWLQPEAFNILSDQKEAQRLQQLFPDGCCLASWNGNYIDVRAAKLSEEWTWGGTRRGFGLYPPAILQPAMDFQDRINDAGNTESQYYDRMAVPGVAYDSTAINGKAFAGKYWKPGTFFPIRVKKGDNRTLSNVLWQPTYHMDKGIESYQQRMVLMVQLIIGITPQMYGGSQHNIDTAAGQEQALKVASGILWLYWSAIRSECARTAKNAIRCLATNATQEVFDVIKGDDNTFENQPIDLEALQNEIDAYPEEEQGFPESREQMADRFEKLILGAVKNPLIMEMLEPMKNRRMAVRTLLPQDMEIPGEDNRIKVLQDISQLMQGAAMQQVDPATQLPVMVPSVMPDKDVDDLQVTQDTVKEYVTKNYRELKEQKPQQFANIIAYLKMAMQFQKQIAIENAPPMPPGAGAPAPA